MPDIVDAKMQLVALLCRGGRHFEHPCVQDQEIEPSLLGQETGGALSDARLAAQIQLQEANVGSGLGLVVECTIGLVRDAVHQVLLRALAGERQIGDVDSRGAAVARQFDDGFAAHAACAAGDEDDFAG